MSRGLVKFVTATTKFNIGDTTLCQSMNKLGLTNWNHVQLDAFVGNERALPVVYNDAIQRAINDDADWLVMVHDDVILEEDPIPKLEALADQYDVIGVAGTSRIELKQPALWHLMGGGFNGGHLHGYVQHKSEQSVGRMGYGGVENIIVKHPTNFGPYPHKVVMIDGVFIAINRKAMKVLRLDESNPAKFHFYDLDLSLEANTQGLKVGVGDMVITHESLGLMEFTPEWLLGQEWFLNKYNKDD